VSRLSGKRALVTGGGSGIGRATCRRFAAEGAAVVVADLLGERAEEVAAESGGTAVQADVTVAADVGRMVEAAGRIDVLVNNAGGGFADDLLEVSEEEWDGDVTVNLKSAFLCSKAVLPGMIEQGSGVIVNIASVNGIAFFANEPYSAAKAGLISLTRSMAVRYGKHGIRAVAIAPGTIRSPIWQERVDKEPAIFERLVRWYPLGRVGEPEDVANAAAFLASDDASWISGDVLRVDGGLLAGNSGSTGGKLHSIRPSVRFKARMLCAPTISTLPLELAWTTARGRQATSGTQGAAQQLPRQVAVRHAPSRPTRSRSPRSRRPRAARRSPPPTPTSSPTSTRAWARSWAPRTRSARSRRASPAAPSSCSSSGPPCPCAGSAA
jgi:NAD(P)-dependent dehydrogenase (short-subunit alcohol dehydrogenase family)